MYSSSLSFEMLRHSRSRNGSSGSHEVVRQTVHSLERGETSRCHLGFSKPNESLRTGTRGLRRMQRPVILALDDDGAVLRAVARDLRHEYGRDYRIVAAQTPDGALEELREMARRDEAVALFVVDQRMPGMTGVEFLVEAANLFPQAGRILLTAYADKDAAIRAINDVRLDHYLLKPWDPPEEKLYPVLTDLLQDWKAHAEAPFEGIKVLDHRWSPAGHHIRSFLARNLVPYRWVDVEENPDAERLLALAEAGSGQLPLLMFPDGSSEVRPTNADIAAKIGLHTQPEASSYDLVIVGAGPAGLAAGVYGSSEGLSTLLLEREAPGVRQGLAQESRTIWVSRLG